MFEMEERMNKRGVSVVEVEPRVSGNGLTKIVRISFVDADRRRIKLEMTPADAASLAKSLGAMADRYLTAIATGVIDIKDL